MANMLRQSGCSSEISISIENLGRLISIHILPVPFQSEIQLKIFIANSTICIHIGICALKVTGSIRNGCR